jgi:hypothetical protein
VPSRAFGVVEPQFLDDWRIVTVMLDEPRAERAVKAEAPTKKMTVDVTEALTRIIVERARLREAGIRPPAMWLVRP